MHSGQIKIFHRPGFPWIFVGYFPSKKLPKLGELGGGGCKKCPKKQAHEALTRTILDHHPFLASQKTHLDIYHLSLKFSLSKSQDPFFLHTTPFTTTINHLKIGLKQPQKGQIWIHKRIIWTVHHWREVSGEIGVFDKIDDRQVTPEAAACSVLLPPRSSACGVASVGRGTRHFGRLEGKTSLLHTSGVGSVGKAKKVPSLPKKRGILWGFLRWFLKVIYGIYLGFMGWN